ncbi:MAG: ABC transporter ATP-binding protein, partial [Candidatus Methanomethylophilaceae archaeon]|nr:ABC transporter ATP-binding protein [Candidatus Methanomethylophilaceae archaeon]
MPSDGPMLEVSEMAFSYSDEGTLKNIDFEIMPGEFVALMGPNGSGKTTMMRCINKIHKPSSGKIEIDSEDIMELSMGEIARICTTVPADTAVDFSLSVRDYVALGRSPFIKTIWWEDEKDEELVNDAMWRMGIAHYANRRLHELSSGERARVLLAKGLVQT